MNTAISTVARSFVILAVTVTAAAAGCGPVDPLEIDDAEFRNFANNDPNPSLAQLVIRPPLYPVHDVGKGSYFPGDPETHGDYDIVSGAIMDPAGGTRYGPDINGLYLFGNAAAIGSESACAAFEEDYEMVPIAANSDLSICVAAEQGCCDFICKQWGAEVDSQDPVGFVDQDVMDNDAIVETFVDQYLVWDSTDPDERGGLGRDSACACNCTG